MRNIDIKEVCSEKYRAQNSRIMFWVYSSAFVSCGLIFLLFDQLDQSWVTSTVFGFLGGVFIAVIVGIILRVKAGFIILPSKTLLYTPDGTFVSDARGTQYLYAKNETLLAGLNANELLWFEYGELRHYGARWETVVLDNNGRSATIKIETTLKHNFSVEEIHNLLDIVQSAPDQVFVLMQKDNNISSDIFNFWMAQRLQQVIGSMMLVSVIDLVSDSDKRHKIREKIKRHFDIVLSKLESQPQVDVEITIKT